MSINNIEREELYSARWSLTDGFNGLSEEKKQIRIAYAKQMITNVLNSQNFPKTERDENEEREPEFIPEEPEVHSKNELNAKALWYPLAETDFKAGRTRGSYRKGYPEGALVHFTSGWHNQSLKSGTDFQVKKGFLYFMIDEDGKVSQNFPLNKWGYHAGTSGYKGFSGSMSKYLVGIEVISPGKLDKVGKKCESWFHQEYPKKETKTFKSKENIKAGVYHQYTEKQHQSLKCLLLWLYRNNTDVFSLDNVLGHDEVSPTRKSDPGGSLGMTMPEYRKFLKGLV